MGRTQRACFWRRARGTRRYFLYTAYDSHPARKRRLCCLPVHCCPRRCEECLQHNRGLGQVWVSLRCSIARLAATASTFSAGSTGRTLAAWETSTGVSIKTALWQNSGIAHQLECPRCLFAAVVQLPSSCFLPQCCTNAFCTASNSCQTLEST